MSDLSEGEGTSEQLAAFDEAAKKPESDAVNHPSHYANGKIEVIEFIEDQGLGAGFCLGNAIKYIARAGKKDPSKTIEDLEKAAWYLARQIEILKAARDDRSAVRPNDMNRKSSAR